MHSLIYTRPTRALGLKQIGKGALSQREPGKQGGKHEPDNIKARRAPQGAANGGSSLLVTISHYVLMLKPNSTERYDDIALSDMHGRRVATKFHIWSASFSIPRIKWA